ncbi:hypothetical protein [Actinokineospora iranica]|uniref:Oxidoreductase n=1 Tax=Actinokineospora iranica TaxID=1271860 RepID=A0A1G6Q2A8_9PSEU|nr:hypothetical protein [Actinokineospora iranica]SDC86503.1 hypothetical protein SAMN05216174_10553 [Actinokineospora iranica]
MAGKDVLDEQAGGVLDPHAPNPPAWARMPAADVVRRAAEPDTGGVLRRRKPNIAPVVRVADRYLVGPLDLRAVEFPYLLEFERCRFEQPPDLRQARLAGVEFRDCSLPGLQGRNLRSDNDVQLVSGTVVRGTVDLTDGEIHGSLVLRDSTLVAVDGPALHADRLHLVGALLAAGLAAHGEIRIAGLRSGGNVNFAGALLDNPSGLAMNANGLHVGGNLHFTIDPRTGVAFRSVGQVFLPSARVDSDFSLRGAQLSPRREHSRPVPPDDPFFDPNAALVADRSKVDGNVNLDRGFVSTGTIRIVNAHIGGSLRLAHARIDLSGGQEPFVERVGAGAAPPGPYPDRALHLDGTEVRGGIDARDMRVAGQTRLVDVQVQGSVLLDRAVMSNRGGDALEGRRFTVGGNLDGRSLLVFGSVLLPGAKIGSNLDLRGSRLLAPGRYPRDKSPKPSLDLRVAHIGRDLVCADGDEPFSAHGEVRVRRAVVSRELNFHGAELGNGRNAVALNAFGVQTQELRLDVGAPPRGRVDLRHLRCASLSDNERFWDAHGRIELEDFRYDALATPIELDDDTEVMRRLRWLRQGMREVYRPGPYDQFAAMLRACGNEEHAAAVLVEKQRRRYAALAEGARLARPGIQVWSWLQRWMVGYGYRPTRALAWLIAFLVLGTVWFALIPRPHEANSDDHLVWNPVLYTLDLLVPIVDFGHKNKWTVPGASQWISATLIALGWILATTVAAGITRMLRRTS